MFLSFEIGGKEYSLDAIMSVLLSFVEDDEQRLIPLLDKAEAELDQEDLPEVESHCEGERS